MVDGVRLPILGRLGQRVSWMIFAGLLVMAAVANLGFVDPATSLIQTAYAAILVGVAGATFDIVIDGAVVETRTIQLGVNGQFIFFSPFSGPLQVRVKGSKWISALSGVINAGPGSVTGINLLCPGGDVDDDNEVSILDYIFLSTAYGSEQGQPSYRAAADLDGDGMITILDYLILSKNYGRMGA
jgi:hypothetical protein